MLVQIEENLLLIYRHFFCGDLAWNTPYITFVSSVLSLYVSRIEKCLMCKSRCVHPWASKRVQYDKGNIYIFLVMFTCTYIRAFYSSQNAFSTHADSQLSTAVWLIKYSSHISLVRPLCTVIFTFNIPKYKKNLSIILARLFAVVNFVVAFSLCLNVYV